MSKKLILDGESLTPEKLVEFGYDDSIILEADPKCREKVDHSRKFVDDTILKGETKYGINTGFGNFSYVVIPEDKIDQLQLNLIRSHCCGVGSPLTIPRTRMLMALRVNTLLKGYSGIRYSVLETYIKAVNANIIPWVPEKGTVGASGDLAPLAHIALGLIGEGKVWNPKKKEYEMGAEVMKEFGLECIQLKAKEGLSLINGTQFMSALLSEGVVRASNLILEGDTVAALSLEALHGSYKAFDERIHLSRPHSGQIQVAKRIRSIFGSGSEINRDHKNCKLVQDAYTLRCIPQVHGIVVDTIEFVRGIVTIEINSATDNPMVFENHDIVSGGNFHGEYVAKAADFLTIAIAELGNMSERRIARMIDHQLSPHLPGFLVKDGGLNSGFMMAQVTAASLVSENKVLCHPSSSDTIPTSGNKEDHISCGGFAARKLLTVIDHVEYIVAIEMMSASQALSFSKPLKTTQCLEAVNTMILEHIPYYDQDRNLSKDIEVAKVLIQKNMIWECAKKNLEEK